MRRGEHPAELQLLENIQNRPTIPPFSARNAWHSSCRITFVPLIGGIPLGTRRLDLFRIAPECVAQKVGGLAHNGDFSGAGAIRRGGR
jgi:hypothetical protein